MEQSIIPDGYLPRIVDEQIERYLKTFGAIEIAGTKWCGTPATTARSGYPDAAYRLGRSL